MRMWNRLLVAMIMVTMTFVACKKDKSGPAKGPGSAAGGVTTPTDLPKVESRLGSFPKQILVIAAVQSFDDLKAFLNRAAGGMGAPLDFEKEIVDSIASTYKIGDSKILDRSKPFFFLFAGKEKEEAEMAMIPITGRPALEKALGEARGDGTAGNALTIKGPFQTNHANFLDSYLVVSSAPGAFEAHRAFLDKLASFKPSSPVQVLIPVGNLMATYGDQIEGAKDKIVREMLRNAMGPMRGVSGFTALYNDQIDAIFDAARSLDLLDIHFDADDTRLTLSTMGSIKPGSSLQGFMGKCGTDLGLASLLPKTSYFVGASDVNPSVGSSWTEKAVGAWSQVLNMTGDEQVKLREIVKSMMSNQTGASAFSLYEGDGFPLSIFAVNRVKSGKQAKKDMDAIGDLMLRKMRQMAGAMGDGGPAGQFDFSSWKALFTQVGKMTAGFGINLEVIDSDPVYGLRLKVAYDRIPGAAPQMGQSLKKALGDTFELAFGFGDDLMAVAFGPTAVGDVEQGLAGKASFEADGYRSSLSRAAAKPFVTVWMDLGAGLKGVAPAVREIGKSFLGEMAAQIASKLGSLKPGAPFAFTVGGDPKVLHVVMEIPYRGVQDLRSLGR